MGQQLSSPGKHGHEVPAFDACLPQFVAHQLARSRGSLSPNPSDGAYIRAVPDIVLSRYPAGAVFDLQNGGSTARVDPAALNFLCGMCEANDSDGIEQFCRQGNAQQCINSVSIRPERLGLAPLHLAALRGHVAAFLALVRNGASLDLPSGDGHRVEYYAMLNRNRPMLKAISELRVKLQAASHASVAAAAASAHRRVFNAASEIFVPHQWWQTAEGSGVRGPGSVSGTSSQDGRHAVAVHTRAPGAPAAAEPEDTFAGRALQQQARPVQFQTAAAAPGTQLQRLREQERAQLELDALRRRAVEGQLAAQRAQHAQQRAQSPPPYAQRALSPPPYAQRALSPMADARQSAAGSSVALSRAPSGGSVASRATARRLFGAGAPPPPADPPAAPAGDWEEDAHARCFPRNPFRRTATASSSAAGSAWGSPEAARRATSPTPTLASAGAMASPSGSVPAAAAPAPPRTGPPPAPAAPGGASWRAPSAAPRAAGGVSFGSFRRVPLEAFTSPEVLRCGPWSRFPPARPAPHVTLPRAPRAPRG
jgi:hypothetical protein